MNRHWFAIRDLSLILAFALLGLYYAYAVDIFANEGSVAVHEATIELDEALLIGGLVSVALLIFGARQYLAQKREVERRVAAEHQVRELAYQDVLTGLPNRRQYTEALRSAVAAPPAEGAGHGVFMLDLNGFKQINDVRGHTVGDEVLAVVAQRLRSAMRGADMVARLGGDEFAVLTTHLADPEAAANVALRMIETLEAPIVAGGAVHRVSMGIGIALVPADAVTAEDALRKADVALYRAKAERRSAYRFFESAMDARIEERASMELALRKAMDGGQIEAEYRPMVHLKTREVIGFEVAPSWVDPERGPIAAERFIAIAEEVGLIHAIAERVLRQACDAARGWPTHVRASIDIYPSQLKDRLLPARILHILAETGLASGRLEIEITESALVADMENAQRILGSLRDAGVRIALAKFGTGYSSLYHLRNFKIDKVKIDRSFIHAMGSERASAGIVSALVGLGHGLGLTIAADGIDAIDQETSLIITGCEEGQGHLFGAPTRADQTYQFFTAEGKLRAG